MVDINALAAQSAAQGQQQLQDYQNKATDYRGQYGNYQAQADAANKNVQNYTNYMQNEGSAGNQYHNEMTKQQADLGYSPEQMTAARGNLNQATGALSAYSDFANQAASKWGLNAGGFAAANAGALSGLNNNIASNQGVVNSLSDLYKTAQTGANQFTGQVIQGEHETLGGLQATFANAANQRDSAASMMNFYDDLASKQGGLNAQNQASYAQAKQLYAAAQQAMAQSAYLMSQTTGQNLANTRDQAYMNSQAYQNQLKYGNPNGPTNQGSGGSNGSNGYHPPSVLQDNLDFWGHTAPTAIGHAATTVGKGALNWGKGLFTGASW